jgi:hypothetical protein
LAQSVSAAVRFGVDKEDAVQKMNLLQDRLKTLEGVRRGVG